MFIWAYSQYALECSLLPNNLRAQLDQPKVGSSRSVFSGWPGASWKQEVKHEGNGLSGSSLGKCNPMVYCFQTEILLKSFLIKKSADFSIRTEAPLEKPIVGLCNSLYPLLVSKVLPLTPKVPGRNLMVSEQWALHHWGAYWPSQDWVLLQNSVERERERTRLG